MPDRQALDNLLWMVRLGVIGIVVVIVAIQARAGLDTSTVGYGVVLAAVAWLMTARMRSTGLKCAAEDAILVARKLQDALAS